MHDPDLSVVIPVFNEEAALPMLLPELRRSLDSTGLSYELLFVNDGSSDRSLQWLVEDGKARSDTTVIDLSRNFGHQAAVSAGLDACRGRAAVVMDADGQDPPDVIPLLVEKWKAGHDVVSAVRVRREGESLFKRVLTHVFYRLLRAVAGVDIPLDVGDFRLISRPVIDQVKACREHNRFVRGIISWVGFNQINVDYVRPGRLAGSTKYPFRKLVRLALDGLASFSYVPLQLASLLGFFFAAAAFIYMGLVLLLMIRGHQPPPGWASLAFVTLFLGGIQLISLGTIGEYIGRVYDEVRNRPIYIVRRVHGRPEATGSIP